MIKKLLVESFEKMNDKQPDATFTTQSKLLADRIEEELQQLGYNESINAKTLRNYYHMAQDDIRVPIKSNVLEALCRICGYDTYEIFRNQVVLQKEEEKIQGPDHYRIEENQKPPQKIVRNRSWKLWTIELLALGILMAVLWIYSGNSTKWMKWEMDHYIEVEFSQEDFEMGLLRVYDEKIVAKFRKITPDCTTDFFTPDHKPLIFYGKNEEKKYEYFTMDGNHPETDKSLRPITNYIIDKWICP